MTVKRLFFAFNLPFIEIAMILELISFVAGCLVVAEVMKAMKWRTALILVSLFGIPLHELGHVLACLLFRVPIEGIEWVHVETTPTQCEIGGSVHAMPRTAFSAIAIMLAPIACCWSFIMLYLWLFVSWASWGFDPAWQWLLLLLALSTGIAAAPSSADIKVAGNAAREYPGQFCMAIVGILLGIVIAYLLNLPLIEWWQIITGAIVVFGPGWLLSTVYAKKKG